MNYLVTGGAGFIGSNIVEELLKRGEKVRVLDNFSTGHRSNLAPFLGAGSSWSPVTGSKLSENQELGAMNQEPETKNFELVEGDVRSPFTVMEAMQGVDFVLHQAALPSVPRSIKDPLTTNEVCVVGTLNILKAALACGVKRVIYASSSSVYGNSQDLPKYEKMVPDPMSPYAAAKLAGEHYCRVFSRLYGLAAVALRYFNVFGQRQDPTSEYAAVIPKFIKAIREGRRPVIYGDGEQSRDFTPVANVVEANLRACEIGFESLVHSSKSPAPDSESSGNEELETKNHEPFLLSNVACGERYTLNYLVREICRLVGRHIEPIYDAPRPGDVRHSLASVEILRQELGLTSLVPFPVGLARLVALETSS